MHTYHYAKIVDRLPSFNALIAAAGAAVAAIIFASDWVQSASTSRGGSSSRGLDREGRCSRWMDGCTPLDSGGWVCGPAARATVYGEYGPRIQLNLLKRRLKSQDRKNGAFVYIARVHVGKR